MSEENNTVVILVGGGHAAGKKTVCERIKSNFLENLNANIEIEIFDLDVYIKDQPEIPYGPTRFDCSKLLNEIELFEKKSDIKKLILVPGLYSLYDRRLRNIASMKLFIDCDADTRLTRWITAETLNGETKLEDLLDNYVNRARPEFNEFIQPTKEFADVILPNDEEINGISLICDGIQPLFNQSSLSKSGKTLYPRFGFDSESSSTLNLQAEAFNGQKDRFYDLT